MLEASLNSGVAHNNSCFEVFARSLPEGRRFGVVSGIDRIALAIAEFRFDDSDLTFLATNKIVNDKTLRYLANFKFTGDVYAYEDGELYFPFSPVVRIDAPLGEGLLLETIILSILNYDSAVASAGARMVSAAKQRTLVEMGSRRTNEIAALGAARSAYLVGFGSTSNLKAGQLFDIPTAGTIGHAFIMAHNNELEAFQAQIESQGVNTTILVDTYDIETGIIRAVKVAGTELGSIRIDSGVPMTEAIRARKLLNSMGATKTRILLSGDLDEYKIEELSLAPIDGYGIGTKLVTGSGFPTANFVYKLVAIAKNDSDRVLRPVSKSSVQKETMAGPKFPIRILDQNNKAEFEFLSLADSCDSKKLVTQLFHGANYREIQKKIVENGKTIHSSILSDLRLSHFNHKSELNETGLVLDPGPPAIKTVAETKLGTVPRPIETLPI